MQSCLGVEQDLEKALSKFRGLDEHSERVLTDAIQHINDLKRELSEVPEDFVLTQSQIEIIRDTVQRCKETIQRLSTDHRDIHSSVSRVGKSIDRNFVSEYGVIAPRASQFYTDANHKLINQAIAQHLYGQSLDEAADTLCRESDVTVEERCEPFAALSKIATSLTEGHSGPALEWVNKHANELKGSPLPFALHRLAFFEIAARDGPSVAVQYSKIHFPQFAAKHERDIQRAMCLLAYYNCPETPQCYSELRDRRALATMAAELFIKEACTLLQLAPLSPLAGAVLAGARVLPALLDIRTKLSLPQASAWANMDELPIEVDLGEGGGHHSVFACPILRLQASELNPPMRLLCGHVISRDALTKLIQGVNRGNNKRSQQRLKCPYCPMEQVQSEARLIYF